MKLYKALWLTFLILLTLPFLQSKLHLVHVKPLKGYIEPVSADTLTLKKWFAGDFQVKQEEYLNESFGFRGECVRFNNQIAYSFFNKALARGVIIGKNNYLYEENYIKAYYGTDFIGYDSINRTIKKLKNLQDTLFKLNKTLIPVFAAGKGSFYPEYFPDEYKTAGSTTNYECYVKSAAENNLRIIDFNRYFLEQKYTSEYPLYPQFGIHWSHYGQCIAADSIIGYIEYSRGIDMPVQSKL